MRTQRRSGEMRLGLVLGVLVVGVALVLWGTLRERDEGALDATPEQAAPGPGSEEPTMDMPTVPRAPGRDVPEAEGAQVSDEPEVGVAVERSEIGADGRTRLEVWLRDSTGRPLESAQLEINAGASPEAPEGKPTTRATNQGGRAVLRPVAEVPLSLRVLARIDRRVLWERDLAPFAPGEQRELELELPIELRELVIRVLDEGGEPVPSATLWLAGDGFSESIPIHRGETRSCGWVVCETLELRAFAPGCAPFHEPRLVVPPDGRPVDVVLRRGYDLRVEVRDELGVPVSGGRVTVQLESRIEMIARDLGSGEFELEALPAGDLHLILTLAGATYERLASSDVGLVELRVPAHGAIEVGWTAAPEDDQELRLALEAIGAQLTTQTQLLTSDQGVTRFESVLPGSYRVHLQRRPRQGEWRTLGTETVEVEAGATADVVLAP